MVIVKLFGGLGNQMFQYSFGRSLELKTGVKVLYDLNWLNDKVLQENCTNRDFELNVFKTSIKTVKKNSLLNYVLKRKNILQKVIYKFLVTFGYLYVLQEQTPYNLDYTLLSSIKSLSHVNGYFQTELYFSMYRKEILQDFQINTQLSKNSLRYADEIMNCNSVSLHVRRGDYITNIKANENHGICSPNYYTKAIKYFSLTTKAPHFFVFSDDLEWVQKQNWFKNLKVTFVNGNTELKSYEDMVLMGLCKHNIIANSSFSWWGAWLNDNVNKIVVAPRKWFANSEKNSRAKNLVPIEWIKL